MAYLPIPGLAYLGKTVYVESDVTEVPSPPVVTPPPVVMTTIPYRTVAANGGENPENYYLYKMNMQYRTDLKSLGGAQQLYPDIVAGATNIQLSQLIQTAAYSPNIIAFDHKAYTGLAAQIYKNLVAKKLGA